MMILRKVVVQEKIKTNGNKINKILKNKSWN